MLPLPIFRKMEERDRRRFDLADEDKSGSLSKDEFTNFLHPEEAEHMRDVVVQETLEDIDKDGDGKVMPNEMNEILSISRCILTSAF